jgi:uncharacterized protein YdcH (DUF465 family)
LLVEVKTKIAKLIITLNPIKETIMENADRELIISLCSTNPRLKKLYNEHIKLEKMVTRFERYAVYSPSASLKAKELKVEKLRGVDEMIKIITNERSGDTLQMAV